MASWNDISAKIKSEFPNIHIWLEQATGSFDDKDNRYTIEVPDFFQKKTIDEKYKYDVLKILRAAYNDDVALSVIVKNLSSHKKESSLGKITIVEQQIPLPLETRIDYIPSLNTKFKFDNFIIGDSNRFANAACRAVAEAPGKTYNPLFLYGGVGLGKTHLLHAVGNYVYGNNPGTRILIITAEKFLYEVVQKIQQGQMNEFKEKYRNVDMLMVDDIQFLRGDKATEEFFHTFNELYNLDKQIVATSDSPPSELKLEERLKSRFGSGIIVDIQPPDFETRVAILKLRAKELNRIVPDNVIAYLAEHIDTNIRALGASLMTLIALGSQQNNDITIDLARHAIKMTNPSFETNRKIGIDTIQQITADYFNIKVQDLSSRKRPDNIARARQIAMHITRNLTDYSLVQIGQYFGGKDHTTVMHAINKVDKLSKEDPKFKSMLDELVSRIKK
jgi:chromosomal replication initiator protein